MQALAQEYADIRKDGYGTTIENRTPRQREIVDEIITGTTAFLAMLARQVTHEGAIQCTTYGSRIMRVDKNIYIDDLVQEGALQVHMGFGEYDPKRGRIETFLRMYALVGMARLNRQHTLIRVPNETSSLDKIAQSDADPTKKQRPLQPRYVELDAPVSRDDTEGGMRRSDMLVDPQWRAPYDALEHRQYVAPSLKNLSERYREVIERRYGLNGREATDANVLASEMGLSRERVRQIETKALSQMRHDATKRAQTAKRTAPK